jgi:hypothetical protein
MFSAALVIKSLVDYQQCILALDCRKRKITRDRPNCIFLKLAWADDPGRMPTRGFKADMLATAGMDRSTEARRRRAEEVDGSARVLKAERKSASPTLPLLYSLSVDTAVRRL